MKKTVLLIPLALIAALHTNAQKIGPSTLNAAGKTATIGGNEFDWSVGEMSLVSTFTNSSIIVTQGVLQPDDNLPSRIVNTPSPASQLQVFPNPATSIVNIRYSAPVEGTLRYKLLDMTGKTIASQTIKLVAGTTTETVNVTELACATYMLDVTVNSDNAVPQNATYKIQKLK